MQTRKFARYSTDIPVAFVIDNMLGEHQLYLNDLSQGGLNLNAHGCIDRGTQISISFPLLGESSSTAGKISWCKPLDNGQCQLGITFSKLMKQSAVGQLVELH